MLCDIYLYIIYIPVTLIYYILGCDRMMTLDYRDIRSNNFIIFFFVFATLLIIFSLAGTASAFDGGDGTADDPFQIADESHLMMINGNLTSYFILVNDITLTSLTLPWTPLGSATDPFTGSLDGYKFKIVGLQISSADDVGLFAVTSDASIFNLTIEADSVQGDNRIGVVAGSATNTSFDNISVTVTEDVRGVSHVGGLVGLMIDSDIKNSHVIGDVTGVGGGEEIGGLVGSMINSNIENSHVTGDVTGIDVVGGLVGEIYNGTIEDSHVIGNVTGVDQVGGLAGVVNTGEISYSSATGTVTGRDAVGGLVSEIDNVEIFSSSATGAVTGRWAVGGLVGVVAGDVGSSEISESFAKGDVTGDAVVGGLVGQLDSSQIKNSSATGNVKGNVWVGGLVGEIDNGTISDSYATGNVRGTNRVGGLVGEIQYGEISNSMALNDFVNGETDVHRDFGEITGLATITDVFVWNNITVNGIRGTDPLYPATAEITSIDVWNTYPSPVWTDLGFASTEWVLNTYGRFLLPVHVWSIDANLGYAYVVADATHLMPRQPVSGGGGSGTGTATIVNPQDDNEAAYVIPLPPVIPEPPVTPEPPEAVAIIILSFVIGIAAFTYRKVEEAKEK